MQQQKIFFIFLVLIGFIPAGYFSIRAASALFDFCAFREEAQARIGRWEIKEVKGRFPLKGYYSFEVRGAIWHGATQLGEPWHLNEASALLALQEKAKQNWTVWFNPNDPSKSSLEKSFPTGLLVKALLCFGVFAYFVLFFRRFAKNSYN